jgi:hypothetical protein
MKAHTNPFWAGGGGAAAASSGSGTLPPLGLGLGLESQQPLLANEVFLFHGLQHKFVHTIVESGMSSRHCSLDGMFGAALYFAENASKSNQYVHSGACPLSGAMPRGGAERKLWLERCKCKKGDECCMLLCRVTLGDPLVEVKYRGNQPSEFWHHRRVEPEKRGGGHFNSVIGESKENNAAASLMFREYVLFEGAQVFPEYKVFYKRR